MDDIELIKIFLFTVNEYEVTIKGLNAPEENGALNQIKLVLLRKYETKNDAVYLKKVIIAGENLFPDSYDKLEKLHLDMNELEENKLEMNLSDGSECDMRAVIEDVMYGVYLHADIDKCNHLMLADRTNFYWVVKKYVNLLEPLVLGLKQLMVELEVPQLERLQYYKAPVIFVGDNEKQAKNIKHDSYWSNLRGESASSSKIEEQINALSEDDKKILNIAMKFVEVVSDENYSEKKFRQYVFPPQKACCSNFVVAHEFFTKNKWGVSLKVRYNNKRDMAYVRIYRNLEESIMIDQPQFSDEIQAITLVKDNEKLGWRVYCLGAEPQYFKNTESIWNYLKAIKKDYKEKQ